MSTGRGLLYAPEQKAKKNKKTSNIAFLEYQKNRKKNLADGARLFPDGNYMKL